MISRARNDLGSLDSVVFVVKKCVPPTLSLIQLFEQILPSSWFEAAIFGVYPQGDATPERRPSVVDTDLIQNWIIVGSGNLAVSQISSINR